ncbi:MAG: gliding motility-associated C-terminal domain-containing protein [Bacteroidales bacterium]|nr:gliding motility-associated C-terminal domain-containing protein [Bacteroidales bacterium]
MRHIILLFLTAFITFATINEGNSQNRYWVNGTGSWDETNHWSETSGGKPGASVPTENDNVIFDDNSFLNSNEFVQIKKQASCKDFRWEVKESGITLKSGSFLFKSVTSAEINIYGSATINNNLKNEYYGDIVFKGNNESSVNINSELNSNLIFNSENGKWQFDSELKTSGDINLISGDLDLNDKNIECNTFQGSGTEKRSVDLGNSIITANKWDFEITENLNYTGEDFLISLKTDNLKTNLISGDLPVRVEKAGSKASFVVHAFVITDATCYGGSDAEFTMSVTGGTKPYTYTLRNNSTLVTLTEETYDTIWTFTGLTADNYNAGVIDDGGFSFGGPYDIGEPDKLKALAPSVTNPLSCYDGSDGEITANPDGGTAPYTFQWYEYVGPLPTDFIAIPGPQGTDQALSGIPRGIYRVVINDVNDCGILGDVFVDFPFIKPPRTDLEIPPQITFDIYSFDEECDGASDGTIDISASGGTGDMDYYLYGQTVGDTVPLLPPPYDEDGSFTGLPAQTYETYAIDANGCRMQGNDITITNYAAPTVDAGSNEETCEEVPFDLATATTPASANNESSLLWDDGGAPGDFDIATIIDPIYTPAVGQTGPVTLTLTAYGNGSCASVNDNMILTIKANSIAPTSATVDNNNFCPGDFANITLSYVGGTLGTGATAEWYSDDLFTVPVGSGQDLTIPTPAATTTYYVRFEGDCNNTTAVSILVTIKTLSSAPTVINSSNANFCPGNSTDLTVQGGSLGTGATWEWYSGSCGGTPVGTGAGITVSPAVTTTYYVRAEGDCNTTACANITVTVKDASVAPTGATANRDNYCPGDFVNVMLRYVGGTLGTGATAEWYSDEFFTIPVGSGQNLVIAAPIVTTTYYVRFEGDCNNTTAASVTVTVKTESTDPTVINTDNDNFCPGESANLTVQDGSLGTGATWEWYSGTCGGVSAGSGPTLNVSPVVTTTYYVLADGDCNTTACASITLTVNTVSIAPGSISTDADNFCPGTSANLTVNGGSLGLGATWEWYSGTCGGTSEGTGVGISVSPTVTTTYFVRAEGTCNTTACASLLITVKTESVAPTSATVDNNNFCPGDFANITLSYVGGTLGTGATAEWYSDEFFTIPVGSGQDLTIAAPATTTTYYVRFEGDCNNTTGASIEVVIFTESNDPTGINSSNTNFCPGSSTDLTVQGGSLGTGATWEWYSGSCGGTAEGTGLTINVSPAVTTTYYVRAEGTCNTTACFNLTVVVKTESTAPTSATVDNNNFCPGDFANITLSYVGGTLGDGATAEWYSDEFFTVPVGSGQDLTLVAPATTTTYYVRFEGDCNNTTGVSIEVVIKTESTAPTGATVNNNNFCDGAFANITLSYTGGTLGTGATAEWYSDIFFTVPVGSGQDLTIPAPAVTTTYYVRFEGDCNNTTAASVLVTIFQNPVVDILPAEPVVTCTNVDLALDGNTTGGALPFASEVWTGADLTPLSDPNIEEPTFNTSTPGSYSFTYTVIDANNCTDNDNVTITVNQSAYAYAGADTLLCYGSDYLVPDADTLNCAGVNWTTDGGDGGYYGTNTLINPTYTPGPGDLINGYVKLVLSATGLAPCGNTTDTVLVTYLPDLVLSIGKPTPFLIDATTVDSRTHIDVYAKIKNHWYTKTIAVSLVAPDNSVVELKPPCAAVFGPSWEDSATYKFYNDAEDTSAVAVIDECDAASGRYEFSGDWKTDLEGQDPANGAWRIRITDTWGWGSPGILEEATITFSDYNDISLVYESVLYADSSINLPINEKIGAGPDAITDYALPITGLTTSCFGLCDATAIATATGGQGNYTYEWSTMSDFDLYPDSIFETNDTVDLCAGTYYVKVTDGHLCWKIDSVVVSEPDEIVITDSYVKDVSCNGGTTGEIMLKFTGGSGNLKYSHNLADWYNSGDTIKNLPPDIYTLTIRDFLLGCEKETEITINEPGAIDPNFAITPISCFGFTNGEITSTPTNGASPYDFAWSTGFIENGVNTSTISSLSAGLYTVTITDANLCELIDDATVATAPDALDIVGYPRNKRCIACDSRDLLNSMGRIIVDIVGGTEPFTYTWTGPAGFTPVNNDTILYLEDGTYNLTVTDGGLCTRMFSATLTEDNSDDILSYDVEFKDESVCWNDSVEIKSSFTGPADTLFLKIFNEETKRATNRYKKVFGNPYTALIDIDGTSTFQIIRIMNDYCKADFADDVTVTYFPNFNLDILDGEDGNALDDTIYLKGATKGVLSAYVLDPTGITFEWLESDEPIGSSNVQTLSISPDSSAYYKVIATSDDDCIDTSRIYLEFIPAITPNDGFSPNDDGINDYWKIKFIDKFKNNIVTIYNRWGIKVYEQKGYNNDDDSKRWAGKAKNGKDLASGTYYYVIVLNEEGFKPITGPVTIIR